MEILPWEFRLTTERQGIPLYTALGVLPNGFVSVSEYLCQHALREEQPKLSELLEQSPYSTEESVGAGDGDIQEPAGCSRKHSFSRQRILASVKGCGLKELAQLGNVLSQSPYKHLGHPSK